MEYTLVINDEDLKALSDGLNGLPLREALPTFSKVDQQIREQQAAATEKKPKRVLATAK